MAFAPMRKKENFYRTINLFIHIYLFIYRFTYSFVYLFLFVSFSLFALFFTYVYFLASLVILLLTLLCHQFCPVIKHALFYSLGSLLLLPTSQASEDASLAKRQHHRADARVAIYRFSREKKSRPGCKVT